LFSSRWNVAGNEPRNPLVVGNETRDQVCLQSSTVTFTKIKLRVSFLRDFWQVKKIQDRQKATFSDKKNNLLSPFHQKTTETLSTMNNRLMNRKRLTIPKGWGWPTTSQFPGHTPTTLPAFSFRPLTRRSLTSFGGKVQRHCYLQWCILNNSAIRILNNTSIKILYNRPI
jgi:hypothetical protein